MWSRRLSPASLSGRFFAGLAALMVLALLAIYLIGKLIVMPEMLKQEQRQANEILARLDRSIHADLKQLVTLTRDWANWDDSYAFMDGQMADYPVRNFSREMFEDMDYNLMLYFSPDMSIYWAAGLNPLTGELDSCADTRNNCQWLAAFADDVRARFLPDAAPAPYFQIQQGGLLYNVAAHEILTTEGSGPANGWLVQLEPLNQAWVERIESQTDLELAFELATPADDLTSPQMTKLSGELMSASKRLSGTDMPIRIGTQIHRIAFLERLATLRYAQLWTAGLLASVILLVLILLDRTVLKPLRQLSHFIDEARREDPQASLGLELMERRDEIGELSREFSHLIQQQQRRRSRLKNLSRTDPLSGLANRRPFEEKLQRLFSADDDRSASSVAAVLLDVDHFKAYNDLYGHLAGDQCLAMLAQAIRQTLSGLSGIDALAARIGGEEFAVILGGATREQTQHLAEAIRHAVAALRITHQASDNGVVTVSIGVAFFATTAEGSSSDLLKQADDALYLAKDEGRNQVASASDLSVAAV